MSNEDKADLSRFTGVARQRVAQAAGCSVAQVHTLGDVRMSHSLMLRAENYGMYLASDCCSTVQRDALIGFDRLLSTGAGLHALKALALSEKTHGCIAKYHWMRAMLAWVAVAQIWVEVAPPKFATFATQRN